MLRPLAIPIGGLFLASVLQLFAGTPKESIVLFISLHLAGLIGVGVSGLRVAGGMRQIGLLMLLWAAIALASMPQWLTFLDTLRLASTSYDDPNCYFYSRLWQFADTLFLGAQTRPWSQPNVNVFIFVAAIHGVLGGWALYKRSVFWMMAVPLVGLLGFAFGVIPNEVCQRIPFIGRIHHIYDTFFTAAIPFAIILAGLGLHRYWQDMVLGSNLVKKLVINLAVAGVLIYWSSNYYNNFAI